MYSYSTWSHLTSVTIGIAQRSASELATLITQVLESNQDISRRMARIEQWSLGPSKGLDPTITGRDVISSPSVVEVNTTGDNNSFTAIKGRISDS